MPKKPRRRIKFKHHSRAKTVKQIVKKVMRGEMETKTIINANENRQLYHNKPDYLTNLLASHQGVRDPNAGTGQDARIGDEVLLRNLNVRLWLSNKLDRPNVMYKCYLFWHEAGVTPTDATVFFTQFNKMLDRVNSEKISIIDQKTIFSKEMYLNGTEKFEHSQLCTLNGNWKGKKLKYDEGGSSPTGKNIALCVVCYDAYGTLQTDNIASYAYNIAFRFQDP